jgi:dipeptidyl aminopeptidase/acylaminoacyl peptidase
MTKESRTLEADDLFRLKFLQDGRLSPDGTQVIYTVTHVAIGDDDDEEDKELSTIWRLSLDTGETRQMTGGTSMDSNPQWSPDGQQIAFIGKRGEKPQLYVMPVDGGEARALTSLKQGVGGGPEWSPDGSKIAFTAGPDYGDDDPPDLTKEPYRVTRSVYRFDAIGYLDQTIQDIYVVDVAGGDPQRLTDDPTNNGSLQWSPDGSRILYLANMLPDSFRTFWPDIRTVTLDGEVADLCSDWGVLGSATWTPDGKHIVFIGKPDDGKPYGTKSDLWTLDLSSGSYANRTSGLKVGVAGPMSADMPIMLIAEIPVSADSRTAYVQVQEGGTVQIYRVALSGDEDWEPVVGGERACFPRDIHGDRLLFVSDNLRSTPDLFVVDTDGSDERQLTRINADFLAGIDLPTHDHLLFDGVDGTQVEGWYLKPPGGDAPYPTILYIHGGPHASYGYRFHFDMQMLAGAGYGVLFVNHRASTGYGDAFSTAIKGDWGNLDYNDLMSGVDAAIAQGLADPDRLGCCGTSGGGNLSCWIVGQTDRFKAAIPQNPVTNWVSFYGCSDIGVHFAVEEMGGHPHEISEVYARCSPITYAHNCTTPTLMVQSEHDWRCPAEQSEQFYTVLKANGCVVEMLRQPGGSHGASARGALNLRRAHNEAMLDWFNRYLLDEG